MFIIKNNIFSSNSFWKGVEYEGNDYLSCSLLRQFHSRMSLLIRVEA